MQEAKHKHQQVNPLVDQRLRQAYRRVQLQAVPLSSSGGGEGGESDPFASPIHRSKSASLPFSSTCPGKFLDVSFKTSLVESYRRLSYTGTSADTLEEQESWKEWLWQRKSMSSASAGGGVVDDILRLVPASICSETENSLAADTCFYDTFVGLSAFGAFSATARRLQGPESQSHLQTKVVRESPVVSVCTADILALVNDVLDSHLCCGNRSWDQMPPVHTGTGMVAGNSSMNSLSNYAPQLQSLSYDVYTLADDLAWQCISGSSDILTVLAATSYCLVKQEITVSVRVINSAMFKVPTFSLQVGLQTLGSGSVESHSAPEIAASFLHTSLPTVQEGVDYFTSGEG